MLINVDKNNFNIDVDLPLSKSESNRALMIAYYSNSDFNKLNLSDSDDTILLKNLLEKIRLLSVDSYPLTLDCNNAGTVFRFLMTAVSFLQFTIDNEELTICDGQCNNILRFSDSQIFSFLLTGNDRMKQRPIDSLVDALRSLGASIEYKEKEGYPPIIIKGKNIDGGRVEVSAEKSSQFVSSLLLAAPLINGLEIHLVGNITSLPYIDMTIKMMKDCGIDVFRNERIIKVYPGKYNCENIIIEPDWSAAAFWYEMISFSNSSKVLLRNLNVNSLQADAVAAKMFKNLGVETISVKEGSVIKKSTFNSQLSTFNFQDCPDLFPAVIATCAGLKLNSTFTGLKNLSIKESDRKKAMMNELRKINISFEEISDDELNMFCPEKLPYFTKEQPINFNNYDDHRIAMALSILSMKIGAVSMENVEVVSKSYPNFFESLCFIHL